MAQKNRQQIKPLAARMRPRTLDEFVGQSHIIAPGKLLRRAIEADRLSSLIFYGPPGCGKTSLARIIASSGGNDFTQLSAVTSGVADLRKVIEKATEVCGLQGRRTVLFIDEIHRFNKAQQDALLPAVEDGIIILIGATTENPYFEVNRALLSRSRVFKLEPLSGEDIRCLLIAALNDRERGLGSYQAEVTPEAMAHWLEMCGGDARNALNAMELAVLTTPPGVDGVRHIDLSIAAESIQKPVLSYDKSGDNHYDVASAFIKSMRGSDPDAVLHYLARMIEAGEDPLFIARRIIICAAEDVGLAEPLALLLAVAAAEAVHQIGWPEARIPLAEAAVFVAAAPKSNAAYLGIGRAQQEIEQTSCPPVPIHLRDNNYYSAKNFAHGQGYKYPHDFPGGWVNQDYLPKELVGRIYYEPTAHGREKLIKEKLDFIKKAGVKDDKNTKTIDKVKNN